MTFKVGNTTQKIVNHFRLLIVFGSYDSPSCATMFDFDVTGSYGTSLANKLRMDNRNENLTKLSQLIKGIKFAMLTTIDEDGSLRSRPMAAVDFQTDGCLWFFTKASAPKVREVETHDHVNVSFASPDENRYVSLSGAAHLVRDQEKIKSLWNPLYKAWFPEGLNDSEVSLLRIDLERAEYWDMPSSKMVQLFGFIKAVATGKELKPKGNKKLDLTG